MRVKRITAVIYRIILWYVGSCIAMPLLMILMMMMCIRGDKNGRIERAVRPRSTPMDPAALVKRPHGSRGRRRKTLSTPIFFHNNARINAHYKYG